MRWDKFYAAKFIKGYLKPIKTKNIDMVKFSDLVGFEKQKEQIFQNTYNFINNKGAHHAILWGERGCGKSSFCKAVFCKFYHQNLRVIEIFKDDLAYLSEILDEIRDIKEYKFIIFCDDLSFESNDFSYKFLKPLLEGSIEKAPSNTIIYVTSNRRHLISELKSDNENVLIKDDEIHYSDSVDEKISLCDRFGLWISFYQGNFDDYIKIVKHYFKDIKYDEKKLIGLAKEFAMLRGSRSGRVAKQFFISYKDQI